MRSDNRSMVLDYVVRQGPAARLDIAKALGLSPATITTVVRELVDGGLVEVVDSEQTTGRPRELFGPSASSVHAIGVKLMAHRVVGVRVNYRGEVTGEMEHAYDSRGPRPLDALAEVLTAWTGDRSGLLGVGIGISGIVDARRGRVVGAPRLGWNDLDVAAELSDRLGTRVRIDNDVMALALAHALYGPARQHDHFMILTLGSGLGSAVIAAGAVQRGARGAAGELGHVTVDAGGPECGCGARGCLEAYVSEPALAAEAARAGLATDFEDLLDKAASEPRARALFERAGTRLGRVLQTAVNLVDPAVLIVSGEGVRWWPLVADAVRAELRRAKAGSAGSVPLIPDDLDDRGWARGAAACVLSAPLETTTPHTKERQR
ncbi:ROK family transcriptional regulator [Sinosporangium siamense]|nr:ROK family transcriptional regulator [Sinosporangium siamense]